jgi:transposase
MNSAAVLQRGHWLNTLKQLDGQISEVDSWLKQQAQADLRVSLLRTHPGLGLLTSLGLVHLLDPVTRFSNSRKAVAYVGLDPVERSSTERKRYLGISKEGSRWIRYLLIEAAHTSVKCDPELKRLYSRLIKRRGKHKSIVAAGRKLLVRSCIMLRDGIDYAEFLRRGVGARPARD